VTAHEFRPRIPPESDSVGADLFSKMVRTARKRLGDRGEAEAAAWLSAQGYEVLDRNVRTRFGEIDLVARRGGVVVFVEVKSRTGVGFGHPGEAVAALKQRRLGRLASAYLRQHRIDDCEARFDVIAVFAGGDGEIVRLEHIPDAFQATV
jgi:putative endonuclease